jgi:hypothetical protein
MGSTQVMPVGAAQIAAQRRVARTERCVARIGDGGANRRIGRVADLILRAAGAGRQDGERSGQQGNSRKAGRPHVHRILQEGGARSRGCPVVDSHTGKVQIVSQQQRSSAAKGPIPKGPIRADFRRAWPFKCVKIVMRGAVPAAPRTQRVIERVASCAHVSFVPVACGDSDSIDCPAGALKTARCGFSAIVRRKAIGYR